MDFLLNDYGYMCHQQILEAFIEANKVPQNGHFCDDHTLNAAKLVQEYVGKEVPVYFLTGGTPANLVAISAILKPWEAIIGTEHAHIHKYESGAIEACGHKIWTVPSADGKLRPEQIEEVLAVTRPIGAETAKPRMVYITNSTEIGTVYTKKEIAAISECCKKNDLLLYLDGARLGSALASRYSDLTIQDIAEFCDVFYIGGTKIGGFAGEAMVFMTPGLDDHFMYMVKQRGSLLAKGAMIGISFEELFKDHARLFHELSEHENALADRLCDALKEKGYSFWAEPQSNQLFPIMPTAKVEELEKEFLFLRWTPYNEDSWVVRFVASFATTEETIEHFISMI